MQPTGGRKENANLPIGRRLGTDDQVHVDIPLVAQGLSRTPHFRK